MRLLAFLIALWLATFPVSANTTPFYGTLIGGGAYNQGQLFKAIGHAITPLYDFCAKENCADGAHPSGGLAFLPDGTIVGTASTGGFYNGGVLWTFAPVGSIYAQPGYSVLWHFCFYWGQCTRYGSPHGALQSGVSRQNHPYVEGISSSHDGRAVLWRVTFFPNAAVTVSMQHWWNGK